MNILDLAGTFGRVRNPMGLRRWGNWNQTPPKAVQAPARVTQMPMANSLYGSNSLPIFQYAPDLATQLRQKLAGQDFWVRPAARWFQVNITNTGTSVTITAVVGSPFIVTDPLVSTYQIAAKPGDDIVLDYGTQQYRLKIISVLASTVVAVPAPGNVLPPTAAFQWAFHRLDAYFLELTVTYIVPTASLSPSVKVRSGIQLTYYTDTVPIVQSYQSTKIRSLVGNPFFATTVVRDRRVSTVTTAFTQMVELFNIVVARVPDEVELSLNQVDLTPGMVAHPAIYIGDYVNVSVPVRSNLLVVQPPNVVDQNAYPPVDPADFETGSGDIMMIPAGQTCPPGYENIAQVDSLFNDGFVKWEDGATNGQAALINFTAVFAAGVTTFTALLPKTAPATHSLAGSQNNAATYELLVIRNGTRYAYRIPSILFADAPLGQVSFTIPGDLSFLQDVLPNIVRGYLFQSGLLVREGLTSAGRYQKPFVDGTDTQAAPWSFTDEAGPVAAAQGLTLLGQDGYAWLDRILVPNIGLFKIGDIVSFRDDNGALLAVPPLVNFLSNTRGLVLYTGVYPVPYGPMFKISAIDIETGTVTVTTLAGGIADVTGYVTSNVDTNPPPVLPNFYRVETGSVEHTHAINISEDQETKQYNTDGHWVTSAFHGHTVAPEAVVPQYVKCILCARL